MLDQQIQPKRHQHLYASCLPGLSASSICRVLLLQYLTGKSRCQKCYVHSLAFCASKLVVFDMLQLPANQTSHQLLAFTRGLASVSL